jgi:nitrogen fixation-related uncharacterized protein
MFVPLWVTFFTSGLLIAVFTIIWAMRSGQFEDQQRARFLPLVGLSAEEMAPAPEKKQVAPSIALLLIVLLGLSALVLVLLMTLKQWPTG